MVSTLFLIALISVFIVEMPCDAGVGRERVLIVPTSLSLDGAASQQGIVQQSDLNQQILEVSSFSFLFDNKYYYI